jgi:hypothetical protein
MIGENTRVGVFFDQRQARRVGRDEATIAQHCAL